MKKIRWSLLAVVVGSVASVGIASAAGPSGLCWFRAARVTAYSGTEVADYAREEKIALSFRLTGEATRLYALRGLEMSENSFNEACSVRPVPGYLDPTRSSFVKADGVTFTQCTGAKKEATLPDGAFVTGLQVCTNGKPGAESKLKGLRLWGARLDNAARFTAVTEPAAFERTNCRHWEARVNCPAGTIATGVAVKHTASVQAMALTCATVMERSKLPPRQTITAANPTPWNESASHLSFPLVVESTGEENIRYSGVTLRLRAPGSRAVACEATYPQEAVNVISEGQKHALSLLMACTPAQLAPSCNTPLCKATLEWSFNMGTTATPEKAPVTGSQEVSFAKPVTRGR